MTRERRPISADPTPAEIVAHIDQLHDCVDASHDKLDELAATVRLDRRDAGARDMALQGELSKLQASNDLLVAHFGLAEPAAHKSLWARIKTPAETIAAVVTALGAVKGCDALAHWIAHLIVALP